MRVLASKGPGVFTVFRLGAFKIYSLEVRKLSFAWLSVPFLVFGSEVG